MDNNKIIRAFGELYKVISSVMPAGEVNGINAQEPILERAITRAEGKNPWFTRDHILHSLEMIHNMIEPGKLERWLGSYGIYGKDHEPVDIGVVMAGNIPLVGFHDFLCVIGSGNRFIGKLSSQDTELLPAFAEILAEAEPGLSGRMEFRNDKLGRTDAVIATGSNNTARYFGYYFREIPHIIRKNRNSIAVLTGRESKEETEALASDIMLYFGLGCRNVSRLFLPRGYDPEQLLNSFTRFMHYFNHHKYRNNYDYYKAIFMINQVSYLDNELVLFREDESPATPVSVVNYSYYNNTGEVEEWLKMNREQIQCVVCHDPAFQGSIAPGTTQNPSLTDYADGVDVMAFLQSINR